MDLGLPNVDLQRLSQDGGQVLADLFVCGRGGVNTCHRGDS